MVRPLFRFFLRLEIRGLTHLTLFSKTIHVSTIANRAYTYDRRYVPTSGVIFAVNHSSELDAILLPASLPFLSPLMPMFYTSRGRGFYKTSGWRQRLYGGFIFKLWGSHLVQSGTRDYERSLNTHLELLRGGKSVCIFPEGRKTRDGTVGGEAHGGVAHLSYRTGAPVVPVRIKGVFRLTLAEFFLRRRTVEVIFGEPLSSAELFLKGAVPSHDEVKSAAARILQAIARL
ncbi:MAG: 1-acyl-sn-glycerol-3-phosphate acyltransferase [Parcubacteria group bacterium Greene0416_79]|nr:MAG: 1-acyl-sn-glycerol-3-phosphate acyltransferase [Parcubacteria group bacterium Greene0416_79]